MNEQRKTMPTIDECIQECSLIVPEIRELLFGRPDGSGTIWQPMGTLPFSSAYLKYFQTAWFYKIARYQSDYLWRANGFSQAAINNLVTMVMGSGFSYQADNESLQNRLDDFLHRTRFKRRSREGFIRLLTQGECIFRKFGDDLRFVESDYLWDGQFMGVEMDPEDQETVISYYVGGEPVSPDEIQFRKLALSGEKRGVSVLFSIGAHLIAAEQLLHNLTRTADQQSRFAVVRTHKGNQEAARAFRDTIVDTTPRPTDPNNPNGGTRENYESYKPGTMIDSPDSVNWTFPGSAIDASKYIDVLHSVLRLCTCRLNIPETVLIDQSKMGAYNSSVVADGHCTRGMSVWQETLAEYDLELFEMFGFDSSRIKVVAPEIAPHDAAQTVTVAECLKRNKWASDATCAKMFDINLEAEIERQPDLAEKDPEPDQEQGQNQLPGQQPGQEKENEPESLDTNDQPSEADAA